MLRSSQPANHIEILILAVCITLSVILLILPDTVQVTVADRVGTVVTFPYWQVRNFGEDIFRVRTENANLTARVAQLELQISAEERALGDLERFEVLGGRSMDYQGRLHPCEVLARERGRLVTKIKIRSLEPLIWRSYQPVISSSGYLGWISHVIDSRNAWVELLTSPGVALGVEIERTGLLGVLRPRAGRFVLEMVGRDEDVTIGDRVITSGMAEIRDDRSGYPGGGLIPRGLPVGLVQSVDSPSDKIFKEIYVRVLTTFKYNDFVFVVGPPDARDSSQEDVR